MERNEHVEEAIGGLLVGNDGVDELTLAALVGGSGIGVSGNGHADPASEDGGEGTNEEGDGSVGEVGRRSVFLAVLVLNSHLVSVNSETNEDGEHGAEEDEVSVLRQEEVVGTGGNQLVDLDKLLDAGFSGNLIFFIDARISSFGVSLLLVNSSGLLSLSDSLVGKKSSDGFNFLDVNGFDQEDIDGTPDDGGDGAANDEIMRPAGRKVKIGRSHLYLFTVEHLWLGKTLNC